MKWIASHKADGKVLAQLYVHFRLCVNRAALREGYKIFLQNSVLHIPSLLYTQSPLIRGQLPVYGFTLRWAHLAPNKY